MAGAVQPDEFGDIFEVLPEDKFGSLGHDRHVAHTERQQLFAAARIVQHIDREKIDAFFRKKLFRSEAAASAWLRKQDELIGDGFHAH